MPLASRSWTHHRVPSLALKSRRDGKLRRSTASEIGARGGGARFGGVARAVLSASRSTAAGSADARRRTSSQSEGRAAAEAVLSGVMSATGGAGRRPGGGTPCGGHVGAHRRRGVSSFYRRG